MLVRDVMTRTAASVPPDACLRDAAKRMCETHLDCLPIVDSGHVVGMLTAQEIVFSALAAGRSPTRTTVGKVMSPGSYSCHEYDEAADAMRDMERKHSRRLVVIDRADRAVGIVSLGDLSQRTRRSPAEMFADAYLEYNDGCPAKPFGARECAPRSSSEMFVEAYLEYHGDARA